MNNKLGEKFIYKLVTGTIAFLLFVMGTNIPTYVAAEVSSNVENSQEAEINKETQSTDSTDDADSVEIKEEVEDESSQPISDEGGNGPEMTAEIVENEKNTLNDKELQMLKESRASIGEFDFYPSVGWSKFYIYLKKGEKLAIDWDYKFGHSYSTTDLQYLKATFAFRYPDILSKPTQNLDYNTLPNDLVGVSNTFFGATNDPHNNAFDENNPAQWYEAEVDGVYQFTPNSRNAYGMDMTFHIIDSAGEAQKGRVWTEQLIITQRLRPNSTPYSIDLELYYQTIDGYRYKSIQPGFDGAHSVIVSDGLGLVEQGSETCEPYYEDAVLGEGKLATALGVPSAFPFAELPQCKTAITPNKMFVNYPDSELPEKVDLPGGIKNDWLNTRLTDINIGSPRFTRYTPSPAPMIPNQAVEIEIEIDNFQGPFEVFIDTNGNGVYTDPEDVVISTTHNYGETTKIKWNGKDALGNDVPQTQQVFVKPSVKRAGEIHFVWKDGETRDTIVVERLNGHDGVNDYEKNKIYWNDTTMFEIMGSNTEKCKPFSTTINADELSKGGSGGVNSRLEEHGWALSTNAAQTVYEPCLLKNINTGEAKRIYDWISGAENQDTSFGDYKYIQEWTYERLSKAIEDKVLPIPAIEPVFDIKKSVADASGDDVVTDGEQFTYTIETSNVGLANSEKMRIKDPLTDVKNYVDNINAGTLKVMKKTKGGTAIEITDPSYTISNLTGTGLEFNNLNYPHDGEDGDTIILEVTFTANNNVKTISFPFEITNEAKVEWEVTRRNAAGNNEVTFETVKDKASIIAGEPQYSINKSVDDTGLPVKDGVEKDGTVSPGEEFTYNISVSNTGRPTIYDLVIKDEMTNILEHIKEETTLSSVPVNYTLQHANGAPIATTIITPTPLTLQDLVDGVHLDLAREETISMNFTVTAKDNMVVPGGVLQNTAYANEKGKIAQIAAGSPALEATKTVADKGNDGTVSQGEELTYVLTARNDGQLIAKQVLFQDPLTDVLQHAISTVNGQNIQDVLVEIKNGANAKSGTKTSNFTLGDLINGINIDVRALETVTMTFKVKSKNDLDVSTITPDGDGKRVLHNDATVGGIPVDADIEYELPSISIDKKAAGNIGPNDASQTVQPNERMTYTITAKNAGDATSYGTIIKDELTNIKSLLKAGYDAEVVTVSSNIPTSTSNGLTFTVADLMAGTINLGLVKDEVITLSFNVNVVADLDSVINPTFDNTATIQNNVGQTDSATVTLPTASPVITFEKTAKTSNSADNTLLRDGGYIDYALVITNSGNGEATNTLVQDDLAEVVKAMNVTTTPLSGIALSVNGMGVSTSIASPTVQDLVNGLRVNVPGKVGATNGQATISFRVQTVADLALPTIYPSNVIHNDATATLNGVTYDADADVTIPEPSITTNKKVVEKAGTGFVSDLKAQPGETLTYTIEVSNGVGLPASLQTVIKDDLATVTPYIESLPANHPVTITSSVAGTTVAGSTIAELTGTGIVRKVSGGEKLTLSFDVVVKKDITAFSGVDKIINTATFTNEWGQDIPDAPASIDVILPDVKVTKKVEDASGDNIAAPGEELTYTIIVSNTDGEAPAIGVKVKDDFAAIIPHIDSIPASTNVSIVGANITSAPVADLLNGNLTLNIAAGAAAELSLKVKTKASLDPASVPIDTEVGAPTEDKPTLVNTTEVITGIQPDLEATAKIPVGKSVLEDVEKRADKEWIGQGETVTYTITAKNGGEVPDRVTMKDTLSNLRGRIEHSASDADLANIPVDVLINGTKVNTTNAQELATAGISRTLQAGDVMEVQFNIKALTTYNHLGETVVKNTANITSDAGLVANPSTELKYIQPALTLVKTVADSNTINAAGDTDGKAEPGEKLTYTLTVSNTSDVTSFDTVIQDDLASILAYILPPSTTEKVRVDGVDSSFTVAQMVAGQMMMDIPANTTKVITFDVTVRSNLDVNTINNMYGTTDLINTAKATSTNPVNNRSITASDTTTIETAQPTVKGEKFVTTNTTANTAVDEGILSYALVATNSGTALARNVQFKDTLSGLKNYIVDGNNFANIPIVVTIDGTVDSTYTTLAQLETGFHVNIPAGSDARVTFDVKLQAGVDFSGIKNASGANALTNTATVGPDTPSTNTTIEKPLVTVDKTSDVTHTEPSGTINYTITLANSGNVTSYNTKVTDTLSQIIAYIDAPDSHILSINGVASSYRVADLRAGTVLVDVPAQGTTTIDFAVQTKLDLKVADVVNEAGAPGKFTNKVVAETPYGDKPEKSYTIGTITPKLTINKTALDAGGDGFVQASEGINYTITVKNTGDATSYNTTIGDPMTAVLNIVDAPTATDYVTVTSNKTPGNNSTTTYTIADLMAGNIKLDLVTQEEVVLTFTVTAKEKADFDETIGTVDNTAYAANAIERVEKKATVVLGSSKLDVGKTADTNTVADGQIVTYTINVKNNGTIQDIVTIQDEMLGIKDNIVNGDDLSKITVEVNNNGTLSTKTGADLAAGFTENVAANTAVSVTFKVQSKPGLDVTGKTLMTNTAAIHSNNESHTYEPKKDIQYIKPSVSITKDVKDSLPAPLGDMQAQTNEKLSYTLVVANSKQATSTDTIIKDDLSLMQAELATGYQNETVVVKSNQPSTSPNHNKTYKVSDVMRGIVLQVLPLETLTLTFDVTTADSFTGTVTHLENIATVTNKAGNTDSDEVKLLIVKPNIIATKSAVTRSGDKVVSQGEDIFYTIDITNTGDARAYGVHVQDTLTEVLALMPLPADLTRPITVTGTAAIDGNATTLQDLINGFKVDIHANDKAKITFTIPTSMDYDYSQITNTSADGTKQVTNRATVGGTPIEETLTFHEPQITLTKSVVDSLPVGARDGFAQPGETINYKVVVTNSGEATSFGTKIEDTLSRMTGIIVAPKATDVVKVSRSTQAGKVDESLTDLIAGQLVYDIKSGETITIEYSVVVRPNLKRTEVATTNAAGLPNIQNEAIAINTFGQETKDEKAIDIKVPKLTIKKEYADASGDDKLQPKENIEYSIIVANEGEATSYQTQVQDKLTEVLKHTTASIGTMVEMTSSTNPAKDASYPLQDLITGNIFVDIETGEIVTFIFNVDAKADLNTETITSIPNTATAKTAYEKVEDTVTIETGVSVLDGGKTSDTVPPTPAGTKKEVVPGDKVTFKIHAINNGTVDDNIYIKDDLSAMNGQFKHATDLTQIPIVVTNDGVVDATYTNLRQLATGQGIKLLLAPGKRAEVTFEIQTLQTVDVSELPLMKNSANIRSEDTDIEIKPETTIPFKKPVLTITKDVKDTLIETSGVTDGKAQAGERLDYTIAVQNTGAAISYETVTWDNFVYIKDYLKVGYENNPVTVTHTNASGSDTVTATTIAALIEDVATSYEGYTLDLLPQEKVQFAFSVDVKANANFTLLTAGRLENVAHTKNKLGTHIYDDASIDVVAPQVKGTKQATTVRNNGATLGEQEVLTYTLRATNTGNAAAYNVPFQDTMASLLPYIKDGSNPSNIPLVLTINGTVDTTYTNLQELIDGFTLTVPKANGTTASTAIVTFDVELASNVNVSAIPGATFTNTAVVGPDTPTTKTDIEQPKLKLQKTMQDTLAPLGSLQPNENFTYTITVKNDGLTTSHNTHITDTLEFILDYIDDPSANTVWVDGVDTGLTVADLMAGSVNLTVLPNQTITLVFDAHVKANQDMSQVESSVGKPGFMTNIVSATNDHGNTPTAKTETPVITPKLKLTKKVLDEGGDKFVQASEKFSYEIMVQNTGTATSYATQIQDDLAGILASIDDPTGNVVEIASTGGTNNDTTTYHVADLMAGTIKLDIVPNERVYLTFDVRAKADLVVVDGTTLDNTAYARTPLEEVHGDASIALGSSTLTPKKEADTTTVGQGDTVTYTITVTNDGTIKDTVTIKDTLSSIKNNIVHGDALSNIPVTVNNNGVVTTKTAADLELGIPVALKAGQTVVVTFTVQSLPGLDVAGMAKMENTADIYSENENKTYNPGTEVTYEQPEIHVEKTVVDSLPSPIRDEKAQPNETLTYTITASNEGLATSYGTVIQDDLATLMPHIVDGDNLSAIQVKTQSTITTSSIHNKTYTLADVVAGITADMLPNETITFTFNVVVKADFDADVTPVLENTVTMDNNAGQHEEDKATIDTAMPKVVGTKTAETLTGSTIEQGDSIIYTLTADNSAGTAIAYGVEIQDELLDVEAIMAGNPGTTNVTVLGALGTNPANIRRLSQVMDGFTVDIPAGGKVVVEFTIKVKDDVDVSTITTVDSVTGQKVLENKATVGPDTPENKVPFEEPKLAITKTVADSLNFDDKAQPGEVLTYTINIENTGLATSYGTVVQDTLSSMKDYIVTPSTRDVVRITRTSESGEVRTNVPKLQNGDIKLDIKPLEKVTILFDVTVRSNLDLSTITTHNASGIPSLENEVVVTNNFGQTVEDDETIDVIAPSLNITKAVDDTTGDDKVQAREAINYTIIVENTGDTTSYDTKIEDTLSQIKAYIDTPNATDYVSITSSNNPVNASTNTYSMLDLMAGKVVLDIIKDEVLTMNFTVTAKDKLTEDMVTTTNSLGEKAFLNRATVSTPYETHSSEADIVVGSSTLEVMKDASGHVSVEQGDTLNYHISVENTGTVKDTVTIKDTLSTLIDKITEEHTLSSTALVVENGGVVVGTLTTVQQLVDGFEIEIVGGNTVEVSFTVHMKPDLDVTTGIVEIVNTVDVHSRNETKDYSQKVPIPVEKPVLVVTKSVVDSYAPLDGKAQPGETLTYTIEVENTGKATSYETIIQDTLEELLPFLASTYVDEEVTIDNDGTVRTVSIQELIDGTIEETIKAATKVTLVFDVTISEDADLTTITTGRIRNEAVATNKESSSKDNVLVPVLQPNLVTSKTVQDDSGDNLAEPGETLHYELLVQNTGNAISYDKVIQDTLSDMIAYIDAPQLEPLTITVDGVASGLGLTIGDLMTGFPLTIGVGEEVIVAFDVTLKADLDVEKIETAAGEKGIIKNTAYIEKGTPEKPSTSITAGIPDVKVRKTVKDTDGDKKAQPGEVMTYTIEVWNEGTVTSFDTEVKDTLEDIISYVDDPLLDTVTITRNGTDFATITVQEFIDGYALDVTMDDKYIFTFELTVRKDLTKEDITTEDATGQKVLTNKVVVGPTEDEEEILFGAPVVALTKNVKDTNGNDVIEPNEKFNYIITLTNSGDAVASQVHVQDPMTNVLPYISNNPDEVYGRIKGGSNHNIGKIFTLDSLNDAEGLVMDIAEGETVEITFSVNEKSDLDVWNMKDHDDDGYADLPNTVTATLSTGQELQASASLPVGEPRVSIAKSVTDLPLATSDQIITPGEEFEYTITVKNDGLVKKEKVFVQDTLENLIPFIENGENLAAIPVKVITNNIETSTINAERLAEGYAVDMDKLSMVQFIFTVKAKAKIDVHLIENKDAAGDYVFENTARADEEETTVNIKVKAPNVVTAKTVETKDNNKKVMPGEVFTYVLTAENNGTLTTTQDVNFTDTMQEVLPYVENRQNPENITVEISRKSGITTTTLAKLMTGINIQSIEPGEKVEIRIPLTLLAAFDPNTITKENAEGNKVIGNVASIGKDDPGIDIEVFAPNTIPSKRLLKANSEAPLIPGEQFTYVIEGNNTGNIVDKDLFIQDTMKDVLAYVVNGDKPENIQIKVMNGTPNPTIRTLKELIDGFTIDVEAKTILRIEIPLQVRLDLNPKDVTTTNAQGQQVIRNTAIVGKTPVDVEEEIKAPFITASKTVADANADGILQPGEVATYTITAQNTGNMTSVQTVIQDELASILPYIEERNNLSHVPVTVTGGSNITPAPVNLAALVAGIKVDIAENETVTVTFKVTVAKDLDVTTLPTKDKNEPVFINTARVGEETVTEIITLKQPEIIATKDAEDDSKDGYLTAEEGITYVITAQNVGNATSHNTLIQDTLENLMPFIKERTTLDATAVTVETLENDAIVKTEQVTLAALVTGMRYDIAPNTTIRVTFKVHLLDDFDYDALPDVNGDGIKELVNSAVVGDNTPNKPFPVVNSEIVGHKKVKDANGDNLVKPGEKLTYEITAQNIGKAEAKDIIMQDKLETLIPYIENGSDLTKIPLTISGGTFKETKPATLAELVKGFKVDIAKGETVNVTFTVQLRKDLKASEVTTKDQNGKPVIKNKAIVDGNTPEAEIPVDPGKPVDPEKPIDPGKPVDPEKPIEPGKPEEPNNPGKPEEPGNNGNTGLPTTGEAILETLAIGAGFLAVGGIGIAIYRKRNTKA